APSFPMQASAPRNTPLSRMEISHLVGREGWLDSLYVAIARQPPIKWMILQGPPGIGKTSELHRIATYFQQHVPRYCVVFCQLPEREQEVIGADVALELLLSDILEGIGLASTPMPTGSLQARMKAVLGCVARSDRPALILLDNAEHLLDEQGRLAPMWKQFYEKFVHARHRASLIVATKEWPTWVTLEAQWAKQSMVPSLSQEEGIVLLQRLGLHDLPEEQLGRVVEVVGGIPVCLEWLAKLMREPLLQGDWSAFDDDEEDAVASSGEARAQRLTHLLEDRSLFGGPIASRVIPLLNRVIQRLSADAVAALNDLSLAPLPLGGPALKVLYRDPTPLQELRDASLVAAYRKRVQLLPMVAAQVRQQLSPSHIRVAEDRLVEALRHWLERGIADMQEKGLVFTELACVFLRHHRLLATAELVLYHGWLSFHAGQILRLARRVQQVLMERPWTSSETDIEAESGALLLHYYLAPYLGETIDAKKRGEDYECMYAWVTTGQLRVEPLMEVHLVDHLMINRMNADRYEEAQRLLEGCFTRLEALLSDDAELHATLLSKRASLYSEWSGYAESHGQVEEMGHLRSQTIEAYGESLALLQRAEQEEGVSPLQQDTIRKKRASVLNNLAYQLNRAGRFVEALERINHCIDLKKAGYADLDSLAASYGEKSQILAALGDFEKALWFDERARKEIGRSADAGDTRSQADRWIYQVNQARLCLLIGHADEAERLLRETLPIKTQRRRIYQVLAEEALQEIENARAASPDGRFQLDWRWVRRYRELSAYDAYWWWAPAGPFTDEEQQQWEKTFAPKVGEATKEQLREILMQSRDRELSVAHASHREPRLSYPALDVAEVRQRVADFLQLDAEIAEDEPNVVVRRLYHGAIEDEVCFLRLIEATYERNGERFWELTQQLYPQPTSAEMQYALEQVRQLLLQGLKLPVTEVANEIEQGRRDARQEAYQEVIKALHNQFHLSLDLSGEPNGDFGEVFSPPLDAPMISAQGAKRFFEAILQSRGYTGWQVILDPNVAGPRVEAGLRQVFLPAEPIPLDELREYVSHELAGHVARSIAGENSLLGLLGMGTKGYMSTEEGIADYYERQAAALHGDPVDDSGIWLGTLSIGLACGGAGPPQTFSSLLAFFEPFLLLYRLLWRDDEDRQTAERRAQRNAFTRCLRTFRGVPDLGKAGICNTKDVVYLRGRWLIDQAVAQDETVLDRLAVGKVAYELLSELEKLGITASTQSFRTLVLDPDLDAYILSFEGEGDRK
ncbi:MAG TPA: tyrosine/phenylalanine carboxypeptidase domain-containing protein, partial [Ktedonobacteraceae bacterium]|nr:tyrosine/phenylalanine carboxypeptidase domain-containing protein [Ktedonobacteraceae bacterium]